MIDILLLLLVQISFSFQDKTNSIEKHKDPDSNMDSTWLLE